MERDESLLELDPQEGALPTEQPEAEPEKPAAKPKENDELREMRRALKETRQALQAANEGARLWMDRARGADKPKEQAPAKTELTVDLTEAVTNNDAEAVAKALREMGVAFTGDVDRKISSTRGQMAKDQELYGRFPELEDPQSEFFQATAEIYNDLARRDPALAKSGTLAEIAAELADKRMGREEHRGDERPAPRRRAAAHDTEFDTDDDEPDEEDREQDRVRRVARQSGDRGRRSTRQADQPGNDALDSTQKTIVAKLRAAGADISEEGYRKRALAGVRMSGLPTRRPRY